MEDNFIHFLSENTCLLDINGKNIGSIDNYNVMEIDIITKCEKVFVTYTPISTKGNIPYSFLLNTKNDVTCENEYIEVVPFPNNQYDIIMKPFYYYQINTPKVILNTKIDKFFVSITCDNASKINIYDGNNVIFNLTTQLLTSAKCELIKDILVIEGVIDNNNYYLLLIDTTTFEILHNDVCNSLDVSSTIITSYKTLKDISNHAEICKFTFENKSKDIYHVYENNTPKYPLHNDLIPLAFLENIKIKDDTLAKHFLHECHTNTNISKFRDYFGEFHEVYLNRHQNIQDKLNYSIKVNNQYKNYNFIMENNKIKDIEEVF